MKSQKTEAGDPIIDEVRATRQRLVHEHGGLRGWGDYLRSRQERHPEKVVRAKKAAVT